MNKLLYRLSLAVVTVVLMIGVQGIANAQQSADKDVTKAELQAFDKFLDAHPAIASDVRQNPSLVNDSSYLQKHPELSGFFQNHPHAAEELKENPSAFTAAENKYERGQGENPATEDTGRAQQEKAFDQFLDAHPQIAKDLRSNPSLVNDASYVQKHPQLSGFLANHPNVKAELQQNPGAFIKGAEAPNHKHSNNDRDRDRDNAKPQR